MEAISETTICPTCGARIDTLLCPRCGAEIEPKAEEAEKIREML